MSRFTLLLLLAFSFNLSAQKPKLKDGLDNFVTANVIYPMYSLDNCIQGTVEVAFKLNKAGEVTYAIVTKGVGKDVDAEALRLIKLTSGKWELPNNYDTKFLVRSPMKFSLKGYGCEQINPATVGLALKRYRDQEISIEKIINFYRNKEAGRPNSVAESKIIALKNELELDESFLSKKIAIAKRKIKQGDLRSACEDFKFIKNIGSQMADELIVKYCK